MKELMKKIIPDDEERAELKSEVKNLGKALLLGTVLTAGMAAPFVAYNQGRLNECSDLKSHGVVIPDQPIDPTEKRRVISFNPCGDPQYEPSNDPYNPYGPFGPSGF